MSDRRYEKMVVPFNDAGALEVKLKGEWYRTTTKFFRCWAGERRITQPESFVHGLASLSVPLVTRPYHGPVFYMDTNYLYEAGHREEHVTLSKSQLYYRKKKRRKRKK